MIDLTGIVQPDWNRNDATATDNTNAIKDAIAAAQLSNTAEHPDFGGSYGDTILLPKGSIMVSEPLVLGNGTTLQGSGDYSTCLVMKDGFDPNAHFVTLGSPGDTLSSFGGKIRNMNLWGPPGLDSDSSVAMVYTNDAQDGTILDHVRIFGFKRRCFIGEIGYGGASIVRMLQVTGNTSKPGHPAFTFDYGESTMVFVEGFEPSGARIDPYDENSPGVPGSIGCYVRGGFFKFTRVHGELLDQTMLINLKTPRCFCDIDFMTGGPGNNHAIVIQSNPAQLGRIRLSNIVRNGETGNMVENGQPGASAIYGDIIDPIIL